MNPDRRPREPLGLPEPHISARLLATGRARFVTDEPAPPGMLHAAVIACPFARARVLAIDPGPALALDGVHTILTAADIPGENQIGEMFEDEPLLADDETLYVGMPVAVAVADNPALARRAASLVRVEYEELKPVLEIEDALEHGLLYAPERKIERGDIDQALARAEVTIEMEIRTPGQEHLYLETQSCRAMPGEDGAVRLLSSTQGPADTQFVCARVLGLTDKDVTVEVRRLGGAFGGKEAGANRWAALCALACFRTGRPVELQLSRREDIAWTGKRHPFLTRYRLAADRTGRITGLDVQFNINGGACADLSMAILERAMLHAENACYVENVRITGRACRTNLPPNTAMRGFGAPQAVFGIELAIERLAERLGMDPVEIRKLNSYRPGQPAPYGQPVPEACTPELLELVEPEHAMLMRHVADFNRAHPYRKQGIGVVPIKFGISFTAGFKNQASALVWVYLDGSVSVSHAGVEMGQGLNTRVAQTAAAELGVSLDRVRVETHDTRRIGNASPTAASTGADLNCNAVRIAASRIAGRLRELAARRLAAASGLEPDPDAILLQDNRARDARDPGREIDFAELCNAAHRERISLGAHGFYRTPGVGFDRERGRGTPFAYYVFGACRCVAEVNTRTGRSTGARSVAHSSRGWAGCSARTWSTPTAGWPPIRSRPTRCRLSGTCRRTSRSK